jgi:hypothetical protein
MSLLVEELRIVDQSQNVDKNAIVGFLVEITFLDSMIFLDNLMNSIKEGRHKVMLTNSIAWLCVLH